MSSRARLWVPTSATPSAPMLPAGSPLTRLSANRHYTQAYDAGPAPTQNGTVNILNLSAGSAGIVKHLWVTVQGGVPFSYDARLQILYDQESTPSFDIDLGNLGLWHWIQSGGLNTAFTTHMRSEATGSGANSVNIGFPMPFNNGITIRILNPSTGTGTIWANAFYEAVPAAQVPPYRLRSTGTVWTAYSVGNQFTTSGHGVILNTANQTLTGGNQSVTSSQILQLANLARKGWAVWVGGVLKSTSSSWGHLERDWNFYIDGDTVPNPSGSETWTAGSGPSGSQFGSPSIHTTGTEDFFYDSFYWEGSTTPMGWPHAMLMRNFNSDYVSSAGLDILAAAGGYRFNTSCQLWLDTDNVGSGANHQMSWVLLFYDDISSGGGVG